MQHGIKRLAACLCALGLAFCVPWQEACAPARAQAILAPETPAPWRAPLPTAAAAADTDAPIEFLTFAPLPTAAPPSAEGLPPSSLDAVEVVAETAPPTATPTMEPTPTPEPPLVMPATLNLADAKRLRVLLIGTDAYQPDDAGRSDTMLLVQVDLETGALKMVSFLRDLYVAIPGHGKTRLNAAYVYGGAPLLAQTLGVSFGAWADRYVAVNFSLMVTVVDRMGGITVAVSEAERKQLNSILKFYNRKNGFREKDQLLSEAGTQRLSGKQALCYSRIRKIDSDFQRVNRQRKVLEGIYARLRELDALSLAALATELFGQVATDMTLSDVVGLVPVLLRMDGVTFESLTVPVQGGYHSDVIRGSDVLVPDLAENEAKIEAFLQP